MEEGFTTEQEEEKYGQALQTDTMPRFARFLISTGMVHTRRQAEIALLGIALGLLLVAGLVFASSTPSVPAAKDFSKTDTITGAP